MNDSETASRILAELPIRSGFNTWGDEIYFQIPVTADPEDPRETVESGDLAYWPPGKAFCIFYGPTPASEGDEIRPASPVNPVGRVHSGAGGIERRPHGQTKSQSKKATHRTRTSLSGLMLRAS